MMDCKNALVEAKGDFEMAIDVLRKKDKKLLLKDQIGQLVKVLFLMPFRMIKSLVQLFC